jgi:hypothetical protein
MVRRQKKLMQATFVLILDRRASARLDNYNLYRSEEEEGGRPIIDGLYIQYGYLNPAPERLMVTLETPEEDSH